MFNLVYANLTVGDSLIPPENQSAALKAGSRDLVGGKMSSWKNSILLGEQILLVTAVPVVLAPKSLVSQRLQEEHHSNE